MTPNPWPVIHDGKTHQPIPYNPDVPIDIYTWFILNLVQLIGFETAERFIFDGRNR